MTRFDSRAAAAKELSESYQQEAERLREAAFRTALTQYEMNAAAGEANERAETKLRSIIAGLSEYYSPKELKDFNRVQDAWREYQRLNAEFAASEYEGGSIVPLIYASALESTAVERIVNLEIELKEKRRRQIPFKDLPEYLKRDSAE